MWVNWHIPPGHYQWSGSLNFGYLLEEYVVVGAVWTGAVGAYSWANGGGRLLVLTTLSPQQICFAVCNGKYLAHWQGNNTSITYWVDPLEWVCPSLPCCCCHGACFAVIMGEELSITWQTGCTMVALFHCVGGAMVMWVQQQGGQISYHSFIFFHQRPPTGRPQDLNSTMMSLF